MVFIFSTRGEFAPPSLRPFAGSGTTLVAAATRGEFAPPSLRQYARPYLRGKGSATRGEFAPPSLRRVSGGIRPGLPGATRGEFAPPSLRLRLRSGGGLVRRSYEGRIRPSLIAAFPSWPPTLHRLLLRGANSPLPHCGTAHPLHDHIGGRPTRGEFAPPSLRRSLRVSFLVSRSSASTSRTISRRAGVP